MIRILAILSFIGNGPIFSLEPSLSVPSQDALEYLRYDINFFMGQHENQGVFPKNYTSVLFSRNPSVVSKYVNSIRHPLDLIRTNTDISVATDFHFQDALKSSDFIYSHGCSYFGFYYQDSVLDFPFAAKPSQLIFDLSSYSVSIMASSGHEVCDHIKSFIRLTTVDKKFLYLRPGSNPISDSDIITFKNRFRSSYCQITLPHFIDFQSQNYSVPKEPCAATNENFSLIRQSIAFECDPCLKAPQSTDNSDDLKAKNRGRSNTIIDREIIFDHPFYYRLTNQDHSLTYAHGYVHQDGQLITFTPTQHSYGCLTTPR